MKKFFDRFRKANKGFTLVELIIVIAVMAILTVVVAPQYLQYVEKSRVGTDENAIKELAHVIEISYVEAAAAGEEDKDVEITIDATEGTFEYTTTVTSDTELDALAEKVFAEGSYKFKSKTYKEFGVVKFSVSPTTGVCTYAVNQTA